jgi:NADPH-dependent 2,4-dienoyl-CoA reductase/sulfur reductase-like enzyme
MHIVIVGASVAGVRSAESLRQLGFEGRITMVGDEERDPYDRPPLSKEVLRGDIDFGELVLRDAAGMAELDVELRVGTAATGLDLADHRVIVGDADAITFDHVIVATGAHARRLRSFDGVGNAFVLRTFEDAIAIRDAMDQAKAVAVVGAGFIGSEVASAACSRGLPTTVLEMAGAPLSRSLGGLIGARLSQIHADHGSTLRCGVRVVGSTDLNRPNGVLLSDGSSIDSDLVIIGVGSVPNTAWLAGSGLSVNDGVMCNAIGRAVGTLHVHAVGDVARWASERFGDNVRTEHWTAAGDQAHVVASDILGRPRSPEPVPYVWSDQFGHRIQIVGRCNPSVDEVIVVRDDPEGFVAITGRMGQLASAVTIDDSKRLALLRRLIARDASWEVALAATAA